MEKIIKNTKQGNLKSTSGITLIALVITIIVLLILVGITVMMLSGDNGILKIAAEAKEKNDRDSIREEVSLKGYETILKNNDIKRNQEVAPTTSDINPGSISKKQDGGDLDGSSAEPYQIYSIEDLIAFSDIVNAGQITANTQFIQLMNSLDFNSDGSYIDSRRTTLTTTLLDGSTVEHTFTENIKSDLTSGAGFTPIGGTDGFKGTFEGKQNALINLYINYIEEENLISHVGLFTLNSGVIQNLTITGNITGTAKYYSTTEGENLLNLNIGTFVGENLGNIKDCISKATISAIENTGYEKNMKNIYAGGIIGTNTGNVINTVNMGNVSQKQLNQTYTYASGIIGGIVASNKSGGLIKNCSNGGTILSDNVYFSEQGGITGNNSGIINMCYNLGKIESCNEIATAFLGGISATSNGEIKKCYNSGEFVTQNDNIVKMGGILVRVQDSFDNIENNYNNTDVGAIGGQDFEGIAECVNSKVNKTYAISDVLKPGVYVEYDTSNLPDGSVSTDYTGYTANQTIKPSVYTGGWQVLSNDGENVEIISSDIATTDGTNNVFWLAKNKGYKNLVKALNLACQVYLNTEYAESVC